MLAKTEDPGSWIALGTNCKQPSLWDDGPPCAADGFERPDSLLNRSKNSQRRNRSDIPHLEAMFWRIRNPAALTEFTGRLECFAAVDSGTAVIQDLAGTV
jgi:hypothetical protein